MSRKCPHCSSDIEDGGFKVHVRACFFTKKGESLIFKESDLDESVRLKELKAEIEYRMNLFRKDRRLEGSVFMKEDLSMLSKEQFRAIEVVRQYASQASELARPKVLGRLGRLGFSSSVLNSMEEYLRDQAPLIIHINLQSNLKNLLKDDHYRNCFEIGYGGDYRKNKEHSLFEYPYETKPVDRVKYGVLNILRDPRGVLSCHLYGKSYLQLRNVRMRTTFSHHNTTGDLNSDRIATCEHYTHVLEAYNDHELTQVARISQSKKVKGDSSLMGSYKEVQYHGPVNLYHDVECLVVHDDERLLEADLDLFTQKFGVPYYWMSDYANLGILEMESRMGMIDKALGK